MLRSNAFACGATCQSRRGASRVAAAVLVGATMVASCWKTFAQDGKAEVNGRRSELSPWSKLDVGQRPLLRDAYGRPPEFWPAPIIDSGIKWRELGRLPPPVHPNEDARRTEKAELGELLFFDPRLSASGVLACASCHSPDRGWALGRSERRGSSLWEMPRDPPGLLNVGFREAFGWDGAATSLLQRSRMAIGDPWEMDSSEKVVVDRLTAITDYRNKFRAAFGDDTVTLDRVALALSAFQHTLVGGTSWFDQFLQGNRMALSDEAVLGLHIFRTDGRCMNCHYGPEMTDNAFHVVGLSYFGREKYEDLGRYYVTGSPSDTGRFKTPSLRDCPRTGPYMHRGVFSLEGVVNMLNAGMPTPKPPNPTRPDPLFPKKSPLLRPLGLSPNELDFLRAFLETLAEHPEPYVRPKLPGDPAGTSGGSPTVTTEREEERNRSPRQIP